MRKYTLIMLISVVFSASLFVETTAMANDTYGTVLGLLVQCRDVKEGISTRREAANWGLCHGRIEGYFIATNMWAKPKPFCASSDITREELISVFIQWAENNPEKWPDPTYVGLRNALAAAFPCQQKQ